MTFTEKLSSFEAMALEMNDQDCFHPDLVKRLLKVVDKLVEYQDELVSELYKHCDVPLLIELNHNELLKILEGE